MVFQLPTYTIPIVMLPSVTVPQHLAYVEWFSILPTVPDANSGLYRVSRLTSNGFRQASVISVDSILSSVHLVPHFVGADSSGWNTFTVIELCNSFYVNPFSNRDQYLLFS